MKKIFFLMIMLGLLVSACGTSAAPQTQPPPAAIQPSPVSGADLQATAAAMSQQTLQALPTPTVIPSSTPVAVTPTYTATITDTPTPVGTATPTQNPILLTLTATLGTGTPFTSPPTATFAPGTTIPTGQTSGVIASTPDLSTPVSAPMTVAYGTMPPNLPGGKIKLVNQASSETYISLQCTTRDGNVSIIETSVESKTILKAAAGKYHFVAWVGGKKFTGSFVLGEGDDVTVVMYPDRVEAK